MSAAPAHSRVSYVPNTFDPRIHEVLALVGWDPSWDHQFQPDGAMGATHQQRVLLKPPQLRGQIVSSEVRSRSEASNR